MRRKIFGVAAAVLASSLGAAEAPAARRIAYDEAIGPILRARCVECHGEHKQKAKLALHSYDALLKGSDAGPVVVAGKPAESSLLTRLKLPVSDEEHMPPTDHPQPGPGEIALIAAWLEQGASKTVTIEELRLPASVAKEIAELPAKLAAIARSDGPAPPLWELDPVAVAKLRAPLAPIVAGLQRRFPGAVSYESRTSAALHFTAVGMGKHFGDAELAEVAAIREQLVVLDIAGTGVTDVSAAVLASLAQLRVLRAGFTALGDATVEKLASLTKLESVSLPGTGVTGASISAFSKLRGLRALRLAETPAEPAARAANLPVGPSASELLSPVESPVETKSP